MMCSTKTQGVSKRKRCVVARFIGIRHRTKRTAENEPRPTQVVVREGNDVHIFELATDTDELDFVLGMYPIRYRRVQEDEDLTVFQQRHIKYRILKEPSGSREVPYQVPRSYEGLKPGDVVGMILGGSGGRLAAAFSRRAEENGAMVLCIPPFVLKDHRGDASLENDAGTLAMLAESRPDLFYNVGLRERAVIRVTEALRARKDAQRARIACEQRLRQQLIGEVFLSEQGRYPEGSIEAEYDRRRASNPILDVLGRVEKEADADVATAVVGTSVWPIFESVKGCGPIIASGIISSLQDPRRFIVPPDPEHDVSEEFARMKTLARIRAFCGVHVQRYGKYKSVPPEKSFPRKRRGQVANWNPVVRQALYLLGDQFNRRPDSEWGKRLRQNKAYFRTVHPEPVQVNGKRRYTDAHIHKMGTWRTLTQFVNWMASQWLAQITGDLAWTEQPQRQ